MSRRLRNALLALPVLIVLAPVGASVVSLAFPKAPEPERPAKEHESCVRETAYMRLHHMDLLVEIRDKALREGKRSVTGLGGREISLNGCRECHTSRERFCNRCHDKVNLYLDCFKCHYYPE